jgi:acetyl esterase/lipase
MRGRGVAIGGVMKNWLRRFGVLLLVMGTATSKGNPVEDIAYYPADKKVNDPEKRCCVDLRIPENAKGFPTLVWFHGGGLTGGEREFPRFEGRAVALVAAGYRLSPQAKCPEFIEDAAAAVAWTVQHIDEYGGDPKKVFVGGHSAGGYLALMLGMDPKWLKPYDLTPMALAGLLPVSAQVTTHFHVKELRGIEGNSLVPVIDDFAPLHYVSKELPPICLILGDRRIEFKCRVEENELLFATLRSLEHPAVEFHELKDLDHGTVVQGAAKVMPEFINRTSLRMDAGQ